MFKKSKSIISIIYSFIKFCFIKLFRFKEFKFSIIERFSPNTMINIWKRGKLHLKYGVTAHSGTKISVTTDAIIEIGEHTSFNYNCILVARKRIIIGNNTAFGPGVKIYDHDHNYKLGKINNHDFLCDDIIIGNNCWIGTNAIILRGTVIGDNCVVGAGTIVKGKYDNNTLIYNKRNTVAEKYSINVGGKNEK